MPYRNEPPSLQATDPHHGGHATWGIDEGGTLWHRTAGQSRWTRVRRISFTPNRIVTIASLIDSLQEHSNEHQ